MSDTSDRFAEIKARREALGFLKTPQTWRSPYDIAADIDWLIAEVERLRRKIGWLRGGGAEWDER